MLPLLQFFEDLDQLLITNLGGLGFPLDVVKLLIYFFSSIALSLGLRLIKDNRLRTFYSITAGIFFLFFLGLEWVTYIMVTTLIVYITVKVLKDRSFWVVFIISFSALSYVHVYRLLFDYLSWKMDFNAIQMMATCRFLYFAHEASKKDAIQINFFEYMAYIFMFPNLIVGPIPCKDFIEFLRLEGHFANIKYLQTPWLKSFAKAIAFTLAEVFIRPYCDESMFDSQFWKDQGFLGRNTLLFFIGISMRFRYFTAFKFTQTALDALSITYTSDGKYNRYSVADYNYELSTTSIEKTQQWNSLVQVWLKNCVYERFSQVLGDKNAFFVTFAISAVWHGFYLTYFYMFFWWAALNQVNKYLYKASHKFQWCPKPLRTAIAYFFSASWVNQIAIPVALLDWDRAMRFSSDLYFNAQIGIAVLFCFFYLTQYGQDKKQQQKKTK